MFFFKLFIYRYIIKLYKYITIIYIDTVYTIPINGEWQLATTYYRDKKRVNRIIVKYLIILTILLFCTKNDVSYLSYLTMYEEPIQCPIFAYRPFWGRNHKCTVFGCNRGRYQCTSTTNHNIGYRLYRYKVYGLLNVTTNEENISKLNKIIYVI